MHDDETETDNTGDAVAMDSETARYILGKISRARWQRRDRPLRRAYARAHGATAPRRPARGRAPRTRTARAVKPASTSSDGDSEPSSAREVAEHDARAELVSPCHEPEPRADRDREPSASDVVVCAALLALAELADKLRAKRRRELRAELPRDPDVLTVNEGAALMRIGRNELYDAIGRGEVPHLRIGRTIRLSRAALVRSLSGSCGAASTRGL